MSEKNKAMTRRFNDEVWNTGELKTVAEIVDPGIVFNDPSGPMEVRDIEAFKQYFSIFSTAFPDLHFTIEDMIAEGDKVAARWTSRATHKGQLMGIPATGVKIEGTGIIIYEFSSGKVKEAWTLWDSLGLLQELGVIPSNRTSYGWGAPSELTGAPGDPEQNKDMVLEFVEKLWNQQNLDVLYGEAYSQDFVSHTPVEPNNPLVGTEANKQAVITYLTAFPDMHVVNEDVLAEEDKVVVHWKTSATHGGELMGIPPTGKKVTFTGATIYRIADGTQVENWWAWDALGLLQQLGVVPGPDR